MESGNFDIILCDEGTKTAETQYRYSLDAQSVPLIHALSHLPVIVSPSQAAGQSRFVSPLALSAAVTGADGLIITLTDASGSIFKTGPEAVSPECFSKILKEAREIRK